MFPRDFIDRLLTARRRLPGEPWLQTIGRLSAIDKIVSVDQLMQTLAPIANQDIVWMLIRAIRENSNLTGSLIAAAMSAVDAVVTEAVDPSEIIWSGPANGLFPIRRIDQILYDLINEASKRILLVTFAAHRIERLCECLSGALARGASITLVLEAEQESEGQLSRDAVDAFSSVLGIESKIFHWPIDQRTRNSAGRPGKLHAKCAVVDLSAVVSSANLTDDAFTRNLEMGVLFRGGPKPDQIFDHFNALINRGVLREISP